LKEAKTEFEGNKEDVSVDAAVVHDHGHTYELITRGTTFFTSQDFARRDDQWVRIDKPDDAIVETFDDQLLLRLRSDWNVNGKVFSAGSLICGDFNSWLKGERRFEPLFTPAERSSLESTSATKKYLLLTVLDNVRSKLYALHRVGGEWKKEPL